jgi:ParB family chromosome partitioning protein
MVEERKLTMGHARALLAFDSAHAMEVAARTVVAKGLSVRATEELAKPKAKVKASAPRKSPAVLDLEERLTRACGGPVSIVDEDGKAGSITIRYLDLDHLDRLLERLLVE